MPTSRRRRGGDEPRAGSTNAIVLGALRRACEEKGKAVLTADVVNFLSADEATHVDRAVKGLATAVGGALNRLVIGGFAFTPGRVAFRRQWGAVGTIPQVAPLPPDRTSRQRVLEYVRRAVTRLGRGVRLVDVADEANLDNQLPKLGRRTVGVLLGSLLKTGDVQLIGKVVGMKSGGTNVCVPAGYTPRDASTDAIVTWPERVWRAFLTIWEEHVRAAREEGRKPIPVREDEIAAKLEDLPGQNGGKLTSRVRKSLTTLSRVKNRVRKLAHDESQEWGWIPVSVADAEVEFDAASAAIRDTSKATIALSRACGRRSRPLVSVREVSSEIARDPALSLSGRSRLTKVLSSASREHLSDSMGKRPRLRQRIHRIGAINGRPHYCLARNLSAAKVHFRLLQMEALLRKEKVEEQIGDLHRCVLSQIASGRASQLSAVVADALTAMRRVLAEAASGSAAEATLVLRIAELENLRDQLRAYVGNDESAPRVGATSQGAFWTREELFAEALPIAPYLRDKSPRHMANVFGFTVRTVRKPDSVPGYRTGGFAPPVMMFDRAAALMRLARDVGGSESLQQTLVASNELGTFRDPVPAIEAIDAGSFEERLVACACLAFLWCDEGREALRSAILMDAEPGVRQTALWAYGFSRGEGALLLARERAGADRDPLVREFAARVVETVTSDPRGWWLL